MNDRYEKIRKEANGLLDKLADRGKRIERLVSGKSISRGLGEYGKFLLMINFCEWEIREYAKLRNVNKVAQILAEFMEITHLVYMVGQSEVSVKPKDHYNELIGVVKSRYLLSKTEAIMILRGELN